MPFIVECPYCNVRSKVPDRAKGGSGRFTRCSNFFTLTPADDQRVPELVGSPLEPAGSDLEPTGSSASSGTSAGWDAEVPEDAVETNNRADAEEASPRVRTKTAATANATKAADALIAEETPAV